jgi:ketosteroid isomerase-like protein
MSENVDLVRSIYADWERGDFSRADWAQPEIEYSLIGGLDEGTARGLAGMAQLWGRWLSAWDDVRVETESCREVGDGRVLVMATVIGRGKASGLDQTHVEAAVVFHLHAGKVATLVQYWDRDRALADLGLQE